LLTSDDPTRLAWHLADEIESDPTARAVSAALPDGGTVLTTGWPDVAGEALMRRGDVTVWCADSRHEASSFMQRLERCDVDCEPVPAEALARAAAAADLVLVEALAACPGRLLAPVGSHVVAAVAASVGTPVWLVAGLGRRLPGAYVDAIVEQTTSESTAWDFDVDELPIDLISHVATRDGVAEAGDDSLAPDAPFAPELLRFSPF
jgi:translation initiation factor 2B subunit (eIF-2B alpha/beta/delta family)